ncbi:energy transducer TonB [Flavobacterium sp. CS20]|uniref:energy transducer TonB n=1 Tax=Flavobacterium sp. CS20 TaxID=2775246 RepID=UPI001B3A2093|nr:energy transducer TonB [Flavobacterium sp. CS20]QTY26486.1 energy transducer TonB [Flavobacterium sp. CS20]
MSFLETKYEKKSFVITSILYVMLILLLLLLGLKYFDPPKEKGILVNFGTTEMGQGNTQPTKPVKTTPEQNIPEPTPQPQTQPTSSEVKEEVATQETEEAPVIKEEEQKKEITPEKNEPKKEEPEEEVPKEETKPVEKKPEEVPEKKPDPKPDKAVTDAMDNLLNGPENNGESKNSEGNDQTAGDKGDPDGDPEVKSYYGTGKGLDGDGNYRLGGRKALTKTKYTQDCNESGTVVVKIEVDQNGNVIKATPGEKGTTNSDPCLLKPAQRLALDTKFNKDSNAPSRQVGYITYVFKLSD